MKYWNWPPSSEGDEEVSHGQRVDFSNQTYDWSSIPEVVPNIENDELGKIHLHAGIALKMQWGPNGSSSSESPAVKLAEFFKYKSNYEVKYRDFMNNASWITAIKNEIDAKRPLAYSGAPVGSVYGHSWVCDGYQVVGTETYMHMNWGWGGTLNGYCTVDSVFTNATSGQSMDNYNDRNSINIKIEPNPAKGYVTNCGIEKILTANIGSFEDGSPATNYGNNQNCVFSIEPVCGTFIKTKFHKFALAAGDTVKFYSDKNETKLINSFYATKIPTETQEIVSNTGIMRIRFTTDGTATDDGWKIQYEIDDCSAEPLIYMQNSGEIEDGSRTCNYKKNKNGFCRWMVVPNFPDGAQHKIYFKFTEFDLYSSSSDRVRIYNSGEMIGNNKIHEFQSTTAPVLNQIYVCESDTLGVYFMSGSTGARGWKLSYSIDWTVNSLSENNFNNNINLFPNPAKADEMIISIDNQEVKNVNFILTNILGDIIATQQTTLQNGTNIFKLTDITQQNLANGMYYLNIQTDNAVGTAKFILID
jgi:hypothetical protein